MTLLAMPTLGCNLKCAYCYNRFATPGMFKISDDPEGLASKTVMVAKSSGHQEVVLHGGEPLLWKPQQLERFAKTVVGAGLRLGVQTNGTMITDEHIRIFKKYGFSVGVSVDGMPDIGITRGFYRPDGTPMTDNRKVVERIIGVIEKLVNAGIRVGTITVLTKYNAGDQDKLDRLVEFLKYLKKLGINGSRLNPGFGLGRIEPFELSWQELLDAYIYIYRKTRDLGITWSPYTDTSNALLGNVRNVVCWFGGCGFWDTFVWTVLPDGKVAPCDRVMWHFKQPIRISIAESPLIGSQARTIALLQTELRDSLNGHLHRGGCPSESPDGDWRKASRFWRAFDLFFEFVAEEIRKSAPGLKLTNRYPDKIEFIQMMDRGCMWDIWNGCIRCPQSG